MTKTSVTSPPDYAALVRDDGGFIRVPIIAWIIDGDAPPTPVTLNGAVMDESYGIELPSGRVMDRDIGSCADYREWLKRRMELDHGRPVDFGTYHHRKQEIGGHDS